MGNQKTLTVASGNFLWILTLIFVVAKIMGYINWSWWIVFSPLWIGLAISLAILSLVAIAFCLFIGITALASFFIVSKK